MIRMSLKKTVRPVRHFLGEYLMVVVGVLTALALEQWVMHINHRNDAANAATRIEAELHHNLAVIRHNSAINEAHYKQLAAIRDAVTRDLKAHRPTAEIASYILAHKNDLYLDLRWPELRHVAWDVAVANQSIGWIDTPQARRYAAAYADMRKADQMKQADMSLIMRDAHMVAMMTDLETGYVEPRKDLHTISSITETLHDTINMLDQLDEELSANLGNGGTDPTGRNRKP